MGGDTRIRAQEGNRGPRGGRGGSLELGPLGPPEATAQGGLLRSLRPISRGDSHASVVPAGPFKSQEPNSETRIWESAPERGPAVPQNGEGVSDDWIPKPGGEGKAG